MTTTRRAQLPATGVCIVRVEQQPSGYLITVRTTPDVDEASAERVVTVGRAEEALRLVHQFLVGYATGGTREPRSPRRT